MDNQHRKIAGYRELDQETIDLMNQVKEQGAQLDALIKQVRMHLDHKRMHGTAEEKSRIHGAEPDRWLAMGRTDFQTGLMKLTRSVAQPMGFA